MAQTAPGISISEEEEFEFRARAEQEMRARQAAPPATADDAGGITEDVGPNIAPTPDPSMGQVARNAFAKGVAGSIENAYGLAANSFLGQVITKGLEAVQGTDQARQKPDVQGMAKEAGFVKPEAEPQTGPQRIVDMAIQSAVASASVPGQGVAGTVRGIVTGAVAGGAGQTVREATRPVLGETVSNLLGIATGAIVPMVPIAKPLFRASNPAPQSPLNTKQRLRTVEAAQNLEDPMVVPPSWIRPSIKNQARESISGKNINIEASIRNQAAATKNALRDLDLPPDAELTKPFFDALKTKAGAPYREVEQITGGKNLLEQVQQKRSDAAGLWRNYFNMDKPSPELRKAALAADAEVDALENSIDQLAKSAGVKGLVDRVRGARKAFAKIYTVENATNIGDGHISLPYLGKMLDNGVPLDGRLKVMGQFQNAFKQVSRESGGLTTIASGTDPALAATIGVGGAAASGSILGSLAGAVPFLRNAARNSALSPDVQRSLLDMGSMRGIGVPLGRAAARSAVVGNRFAEETFPEE